VRPATRKNPEPVICALYGVGHGATPVLLNKGIFESPLDLESPSVTVICNAAKDGTIDIQHLKITSTLRGVALVLVPPFITQVLVLSPMNIAQQNTIDKTSRVIEKD
jgi:hypothetical protein